MAITKVKGKPLTDTQVRTLPAGPDGKAKVYADTGGLFLIVRPNSRSFGFRGTLNKRQLPMMYLGPYPKLSLADARTERDWCNRQIKEGKDPRQVRANERTKRDGDGPPTVNRLLNRYFKIRVEPKRKFDTEAKRLERIAKESRYLDRISKAIGKMLVADIKPEHLLENVGLDELSKTKPPTAWGLGRVLRKVFGMAMGLHWIDRNPAAELGDLVTSEFHKSKPNDAIDYVDAPRFVAEVKAYKNKGRGMTDRPLVTVPPLLFLIYTGVRTQEVREAEWNEIDWENLLWNVPEHHRKAGYLKGKIRAVPISEPMLAVLKEMQERFPKAKPDDLIFPGGSRNGGVARTSINGFIKGALKWDVPVSPHGFRATLKAWARAQRPEYKPIYVERQFDHAVKGLELVQELMAEGVAGYDDHDRPNMTDPTIEGKGARREMTNKYGLYLESYKAPKVDADTIEIAQQGITP